MKLLHLVTAYAKTEHEDFDSMFPRYQRVFATRQEAHELMGYARLKAPNFSWYVELVTMNDDMEEDKYHVDLLNEEESKGEKR